MKKNDFYTTTAIFLSTIILFAGDAVAKTGKRISYGEGAPFQLSDLPPQSHLRQALDGLPEAARQRAMSWLHTFSFPENDIRYLQLDPDGGVYYSDTNLPEPVKGDQTSGAAIATAIPNVDTFKLHSRPGASNVVFLDFDGHTISGTAWNGSVSTYYALPFDTDGFPASFSSDERNRIAEIWHRVAEDMAPFNIDVTTESPAGFGPTVGRLLFTKDVDANGSAMPAKGAGGVAYVNVWGAGNYASYYSPALVYYNNLGPNHPPYMAEAASHEFGHNLGLSHDGTSTAGYYNGLGSGYVSWAPIMGVGYYTNVTQWSRGEYPDANNTQDDLAIIAGKLLYRADDRANTIAAATPLVVESDGSIVVSNPQTDPDNIEPENKGVIETRNDVDMYYFDAASGAVNITVTPAWSAYYRSSLRGANLDIDAKLYNQSGIEIASSDPLNNTNATISVSVNSGRYYLEIAGVGNVNTPYSDYGSLGEYFISGSVPPSLTDTTMPTPNPMSWASAPVAQGNGSVAMTATTASDNSGVVQYQFQCVAGGPGCSDSAWQTGSSYVISGLAAGNTYSFQVRARDGAGNTTTASPVASATIALNSAPVAANDSATVSEDGAVDISVLSNDSDADGDSLIVSGVGATSHGAVINNGGAITYIPSPDYYGSDNFSYTVSDGNGGTSTATVSILVSSVNDAPTANDDNASVLISQTATIMVLDNDSDIEGNVPLSVVSVTQGSKGSSVVVIGDSVSYTAGKRSGNDTFTYTVKDSLGATSTATVSIFIKRR